MKQTIIHTGFHQRSNEDITHMQEGMVEAIMGVTKGLALSGGTLPNCVLFGCVITPTVLTFATISAGAVILNGEICLFDAIPSIDLDVAPDILVFSTVDSYLASNPIQYGDLSMKNVHLIRKAQIVQISGTPAANQLAITSTQPFIKLLQANLSTTEAWRQVGTAGNPAAPVFAFYGAGSSLFFRKNILTNTVEVRGTIVVTDTNALSDPPTLYALFALPAGYIPAYDIPFVAPIRVSAAAYEVNSNNDVIKSINMDIRSGSGDVRINPEHVPANNDYTCRFYCMFSLS